MTGGFFFFGLGGGSFLISTSPPALTGCSTIQFISDTNYPEFTQAPQIKGSILQDCLPYRHQL